jgi:hypothetical protein
LKVTTEERDKILDELTEEFGVGVIEPDEITCKMLGERMGISHKRANMILNEKVDAGLYTTRYVRSNVGNNRVKAYRKVKDV